MEEIIQDLPDQIEAAHKLVDSCGIKIGSKDYRTVYIGGMGGSAIAGDILLDYVGHELTVPIRVVRGYNLPSSAKGKILFVASSYSGNTEEILSLLDNAEDKGVDICVITTGGLLGQRALARKYPTIIIPEGYPPRGALGYSFVSLLYLLNPLYPGIDMEDDLKRTIDLLSELKTSYAQRNDNSLPFKLAGSIGGKIPVIYASSHLEAVATRWKGQFSENAKVLSFLGILPEMNHNEICGWENNPEVLKKLHVILLRDEGEHPRIRARIKITRELIEPFSGGMTEVKSTGKSLLERIFSLIYIGDFVSFYLSCLLDTDPMPVRKIDTLKEKLAQISRD
jgi:glucose/mannose-6-phosphate isomerase